MNDTPEYLTPDLLGSSYLYSDTARANTVFTFVAGLTMAVDRKLLEKALNALMPRFPQFAVKLARKGEYLVYEKMTSPVTVCDMSERALFSSSRVFGRDRLFAVFVNHKTVYFDFHRALTDEKGVVPFVRAVLFHYLQLGGYEVENDGSIITLRSEYHDIEADDAFVRLDDIPASRPVWYMDARALSIPHLSGTGEYRVTRIHLPLSRIKGEARMYTGMPSTIVSPFFAQALTDSYPGIEVPGEYIISYIQVNLRQYFPTTTFRPFFVNLPLAYNRKITEYPVATVLMSQKKLLEAQLKTDALAYNAQRKISLLDNILGKNSFPSRIEAVNAMMKKKSEEATFSLCNIGNVIMPESMLQFITEFYPAVPPSLFPFSLSTINFKGELVITVSSSDTGSRVCRQFVSLLRQYDMPAYISENYNTTPLEYKPE